MSILNPLADLVAWAIMHIHAVMGALFGPATGLAWGLSIVILVVLIRICLIPLFVKQVHAQRKMAQHAPQLQELRKKYKNDKQRLNEETMKFYKENGVNPLAGCLPMIPQMVIFFSLFYVLRAIADWHPGVKPKYGLTVPVLVSAQKATIFGVHLYDKLLFSHQSVSLHVAIVIVLTVIVSATTTFMTVRQSAKRGLMQTNVDPDNPMAGMQKYMMYIVPFFSLTGLYWQYGLVLYWVTTNLWTLGQQFFMFRNWTAEDAQAASATAAASGGAARATSQSTARPALRRREARGRFGLRRGEARGRFGQDRDQRRPERRFGQDRDEFGEAGGQRRPERQHGQARRRWRVGRNQRADEHVAARVRYRGRWVGPAAYRVGARRCRGRRAERAEWWRQARTAAPGAAETRTRRRAGSACH